MADPSYFPLIAAGCTAGGIVAGFLAKGVRRNNGKPLTEEKHELICRANTAELVKDFQKHVTEEVGKLYEAIKEVAR